MSAELSVEDLLDAYRTMKTIREFEDRVHVEFAKGGIPGFGHHADRVHAFRDAVPMTSVV